MKDLTRGMASHQMYHLVVFYFLSASVIWPDNGRVAFDGSSLIRGVLFIVVWYCQKPLVLCPSLKIGSG